MSRCNADTETFTLNHRPLNWKNKTEIHRRTYLLRGGARHQTERNETKRNETTHVVEPRQELPASSRVGVVDTTILILGAAVGRDDTRAVEPSRLVKCVNPTTLARSPDTPLHSWRLSTVKCANRQPRDARKVYLRLEEIGDKRGHVVMFTTPGELARSPVFKTCSHTYKFPSLSHARSSPQAAASR